MNSVNDELKMGLGEDELIETIVTQRPYLRIMAKLALPDVLVAKMDASDVVQVTLMKAFRKRSTLQSRDVPAVRAWLRTILARTIFDFEKKMFAEKRSIRREREICRDIEQSHAGLASILESDEKSPSIFLRQKEDADRLLRALDALPDDMRQVVVLRHLKGYSKQQIADEMNRTGPSVASLLRRGLARLREHLR